VVLISDAGAESWPRKGKNAVAERLVQKLAEALG
jgi:phosphopantothenoylcysteine decarboxylase/phosphopantothenate--cysteine ligase